MTRIVILSIAAAGLAFAQQFDAVSIKPNNSGSGSSSNNDRTGSFVATNVTLRALVRSAFDLDDYQLAAPAWLEDKRFDIVAKFPAATPPADVLKMKQAMLVERFGLAWHSESRELPVFGLIVAKGGVRFAESKPDDPESSRTSGRGGNFNMQATKIDMAQLCSTLSRYLDRPLQDMTRLAGLYNLTLKWSAAAPPVGDTAPVMPELPVALEEQLGLKLESRKSPISVIVVDRAERSPTEN